ncbi:MAG: 50S ribosomal protein L14e [Candidatus Diapherotrites archaeon]|nr:50S ribosomal protein L14e [Candidatus Diapherotrites archaeon]
MEIGQICIKTKGRSAGRKVVVLSEVKNGKILVDGINVKRKEYNAMHLFPTKEKVKLKKEATHKEVESALKKQ